jgi:YfiR/HmsC-like
MAVELLRSVFRRLVLAALLACAGAASADDALPEYRLKAAVLYNFALFTDWPADTGATLRLCVVGSDPFGRELDALEGKAVGERRLTLQPRKGDDALGDCQIVFLSSSVATQLPRVLSARVGRPLLTVADSAGAARNGVALNMSVAQNKVSFEANLKAARAQGVNLSSRLLRLATEVIQ